MRIYNDPLLKSLDYALDQTDHETGNIALLNACAEAPTEWFLHSFYADERFKHTLEGVYNTILVRATRQMEETLGLVAEAIAHCTPDGVVVIAQDNRHGSGALQKKLSKLSGNVQNFPKHKCRAFVISPADVDADVLTRWLEAASIRHVKIKRGDDIPSQKFWSYPGLFSWDRADKGSSLLLKHLPPTLEGVGADLGCGYGYISGNLSNTKGIKHIYAVDYDFRAAACCDVNLQSYAPTFTFDCIWGDATEDIAAMEPLDWAVMNPPFHQDHEENRELGQRFCISALKKLKSGCNLYMVANRHMPYETILKDHSSACDILADEDGFKVLRVIKK